MIKEIKKYGLIQHLSYLSNFDRVNVYLQTDLNLLPALWDINPIILRDMKMNEPDEIERLTDVINDAYSEYGENSIGICEVKSHLHDHLFMDVHGVFFLQDNDSVIGAVTYGTYKENKSIACVSRISIRANYKSKGFGMYIVTAAYLRLRDKGIKYGQSMVAYKRKKSIVTHFKIGFVPQFNLKYVLFNNQKRFFYVRQKVNREVAQLYYQYQKELFAKFQA